MTTNREFEHAQMRRRLWGNTMMGAVERMPHPDVKTSIPACAKIADAVLAEFDDRFTDTNLEFAPNRGKLAKPPALTWRSTGGVHSSGDYRISLADSDSSRSTYLLTYRGQEMRTIKKKTGQKLETILDAIKEVAAEHAYKQSFNGSRPPT